jgi:AcrR family transcriptional regulator
MAPRSKEQNQAQREQTKQSLIITALQAFAVKVYAPESISYIAQEAGISKGLIYHYFSSKDNLLLGILDYLNPLSATFFTKMENHSPKERLRDTIEMTFQYAETEAYFLEAVFEGPP